MKIRAMLAGLTLVLAVSSVADASQVGQSRQLKDGKGNLMKITLVKIAQSLHSPNSFDKPDAGTRYVGVFVRVTNLSSARLSDCAGNSGELTNKAGEKYTIAFTSIEPGLTCYKLLPHRQVQGWVTFTVPKTGTPAFFDWTPDSGFADATADFKL